ncbi:hypothetical protein CEP51_000811 [Fusarium floridanum]|uniref:Major facilitator superfamily (MFS) profile domain-containing protein n=1 Tax=Fusarium floridanum TaxID=1325733 RepID=A0A428SKP8_9HYPO|nr:hypothetical protein CEP51_000811 [Fusarium floridanum]
MSHQDHSDATPGGGRTDEFLEEKAHCAHEENSVIPDLTPEECAVSQKLRRKVDARILPVAFLVYIMNYIDRNNYASARLQGLEEDLNLSDTQYQTGLSVFFVGYLLGQIPGNMILNWFGRPSIHLAFFTSAWGLVSGLTALVTGYKTIVVCRLILGFVEAPFLPGILFSLSKWYTKSEINFRMAIFFSANLVSGAFGNLIAAGILGGLGHARGLSPWQWLYIIEGAITVFIGISVYFVMPDFPETWKVLTEEERHVATRRLAIEAAQADVDEAGGMSQLKGLKLAVSDINTWILALAYLCVVGAAGLQYFFPSLTASLGYSKVISLLLCAPPYLFMTVWVLVHSWLSDRYKNRFWFFVYPVPIIVLGFAIFMATDNFGARYFSLFLMLAIFAVTSTTFAWIASSIARPPAKRAAAYAIINSVANTSSVWTSFIYSGPKYTLAMGVNIGLTIGAGLCAIALRFVLVSRNKKLARLDDEGVELSEKEQQSLQRTADIEGIDIAAARRLQQGFRYML